MTAEALRSVLAGFRTAAACFEDAPVRATLQACAAEARFRLCHPFGDLAGGAAFYESCLAPLHAAMPDLERRDMIVVAGTTPEGADWVGCMGNYMGTFLASFLDIPPTGHLAHMRYHEFFRIEGGVVTEVQAIWDIPELMMQARAWPMAPQLGAFLCTPAPMSGDGLSASGDGRAARGAGCARICAPATSSGTSCGRTAARWCTACAGRRTDRRRSVCWRTSRASPGRCDPASFWATATGERCWPHRA